MHHCGLLIGALAALFLACTSASNTGESGPSNPDLTPGSSSKLATTCYFGSPSESCTYTCNEKSMDAYCDDIKKQCLCKDRENKGEPDDIQPESDEIDDDNYGDDETPTTEITPLSDNPKTNFKLSELCSLGHPTAPCVIRCNQMSMESYCDEQQDMCFCRNPQPDTDSHMDFFKVLARLLGVDSVFTMDSSNLSEELEGPPSSGLFSLFDMLLKDGDSEDSEESPEDSTTVVPTSSEEDGTRHLIFYVFDLGPLENDDDITPNPNTTEFNSHHPSIGQVGKAIEGWAFSHVLAFVIIIFLFGLVLLELASCFKKEKKEDQMQSIFPPQK